MAQSIFSQIPKPRPLLLAVVMGLSTAFAARAFASPSQAPSPHPKLSPSPMREFLTTVDHHVGALRIASNPYKFIGKHVSLWGSIGHIIDRHAFNLEVGGGYDPTRYDYLAPRATIVVICNSTLDFEWGETLRVLGTVIEPNLGVNVFGGRRAFPTIEASYIETSP